MLFELDFKFEEIFRYHLQQRVDTSCIVYYGDSQIRLYVDGSYKCINYVKKLWAVY